LTISRTGIPNNGSRVVHNDNHVAGHGNFRTTKAAKTKDISSIMDILTGVVWLGVGLSCTHDATTQSDADYYAQQQLGRNSPTSSRLFLDQRE
jgi:hypothetical protein